MCRGVDNTLFFIKISEYVWSPPYHWISSVIRFLEYATLPIARRPVFPYSSPLVMLIALTSLFWITGISAEIKTEGDNRAEYPGYPAHGNLSRIIQQGPEILKEGGQFWVLSPDKKYSIIMHFFNSLSIQNQEIRRHIKVLICFSLLHQSYWRGLFLLLLSLLVDA